LLHELQVHQIELEMQNEELRHAEEDAREYAAELAAIYPHAPCMMILMDAERRVRKVNNFTAEFANQPTNDLLGLRSGEVLRCLHALDNPLGCGFGPLCQDCLIRRTVLDTIESDTVHHQVEATLAVSAPELQGNHTFLLSSVPLNLRGAPMALVSLLDITDRKRAEEERELLAEQLRQSEKMAAIGQLAGGIAHNFNNQLSGVLGYADLLLTKLEDDTLRRYAAGIITSSRQASELASQLLAFSRKGKYISTLVDMHRLISETASLLWHSIDRRIEIRQHLDAEYATVLGDRSQIQSILLNLGLNARDAMPNGGELVFSTAVIDLAKIKATTLGVEPGRYLRIAVADTGAGMSPETIKHIYEPFFTTKEIGKGTGLGLAAVYGTVINHHGAIEVQSELDKGSIFVIYLPLSEEAMPNPAAEPKSAANGHGHVLLVDDENVIRIIGADMLQDIGYEVTVCGDGVEAFARYRECWEAIDVVILDIVMPKMSGRDTFAALREINPGVKVIISSGYSIDGEAKQILEDGAIAFLQKPFNLAELSRKVNEALQGVMTSTAEVF
ncbi:MAG: response regulator, partial [Bacteroidetes bacterium]|nr:response regulator [Bacteroidota bacterium]